MAPIIEWIERKLVAKIQRRVGPYFTGPKGFLQPFYDFFKLLGKEENLPENMDKLVAHLAVLLAVILPIFGILFIPIFSPVSPYNFQGDFLFILVILSFLAFSIVMAGLASLTPFTVVGTGRLIVQYSMYEVILIISLFLAFAQVGDYSISAILKYQIANYPLILTQPLTFFVMIFSLLAVLEEPPFDLPHAKQEIVAGWKTEYSGRLLAFILFSRNLKFLYIALIIVTVFLAGGYGPGINKYGFLWIIYLLIKLLFVVFLVTFVKAIAVRVRSLYLPKNLWLKFIPILILQLIIIGGLKTLGAI